MRSVRHHDIYNCYRTLGGQFGVRYFKKINEEDFDLSEHECDHYTDDMTICSRIKGITSWVFHCPKKEKARKKVIDFIYKIPNRDELLKNPFFWGGISVSDVVVFASKTEFVSLKQLMFLYKEDAKPRLDPLPEQFEKEPLQSNLAPA